jgi:hypothetical protein
LLALLSNLPWRNGTWRDLSETTYPPPGKTTVKPGPTRVYKIATNGSRARIFRYVLGSIPSIRLKVKRTLFYTVASGGRLFVRTKDIYAKEN